MMSHSKPNEARRFRPQEASDYLLDRWGIKQSPQTLARKRCEGGGPRFSRWNRAIIYTDKDLDAHAMSGMSQPLSSTSDCNDASASAAA